jgi:hypothetical protein
MSTGPGGGAPPPDEDDEATFADVLNAFSLDSGRARRKRKKSARDERDAEPLSGEQQAYPGESGYYPATPGYADGPVDGSVSGSVGGSVGAYGEPLHGEPAHGQPHYAPLPGRGPHSYPEADLAGQPPEPPGFFEPAHGTGLFEPAVSNTGPAEYYDETKQEPAAEAAVVRPYALTGGRTKANIKLELETLISVSGAAAAQADHVAVQFEHRVIMEECRTPRSVAEVAALLRVPLGVARVLISDAAGAGLLTVHETVSGNEDAEAHLILMERVLSGLRRL